MQNQQMNQDKPTTLQDALRQLDTTRTVQQVRELCAVVDAGFVADIPSVQFADADWTMWNDAILKKVQVLETPIRQNLCRDTVADLIQRELARMFHKPAA